MFTDDSFNGKGFSAETNEGNCRGCGGNCTGNYCEVYEDFSLICNQCNKRGVHECEDDGNMMCEGHTNWFPIVEGGKLVPYCKACFLQIDYLLRKKEGQSAKLDAESHDFSQKSAESFNAESCNMCGGNPIYDKRFNEEWGDELAVCEECFNGAYGAETFETQEYDEWKKSAKPHYISNPNPRKKYERNYKANIEGSGEIVFHKSIAVIDDYDGEKIEHDVVIIKEKGKFIVGFMNEGHRMSDDLKFFVKGMNFYDEKTFKTLKEAKKYISRGETLDACEHDSGFKLSDPDSTFYDSHETFDFYCLDCGITALGDVEPNFRYFGEGNEDFISFSADGYKGIPASKIEILKWYVRKGGKAGFFHDLPSDVQIRLQMGNVHELLFQDVNRWLQDNGYNPHMGTPDWLSAESFSADTDGLHSCPNPTCDGNTVSKEIYVCRDCGDHFDFQDLGHPWNIDRGTYAKEYGAESHDFSQKSAESFAAEYPKGEKGYVIYSLGYNEGEQGKGRKTPESFVSMIAKFNDIENSYMLSDDDKSYAIYTIGYFDGESDKIDKRTPQAFELMLSKMGKSYGNSRLSSIPKTERLGTESFSAEDGWEVLTCPSCIAPLGASSYNTHENTNIHCMKCMEQFDELKSIPLYYKGKKMRAESFSAEDYHLPQRMEWWDEQNAGSCEVCDLDFSSWFVKDDGVLKQICSVCADDFRKDRKSAESFSADEQKACHKCGKTEKDGKLWWVGSRKGFICGGCSDDGKKYRAESYSAEEQWMCWECGDKYPVSQLPTKIVNDSKDPYGSKGITGSFCSNCSKGAESFNAKGIDTFTEPFEEMGVPKWLIGIGGVVAAITGINYLSKKL